VITQGSARGIHIFASDIKGQQVESMPIYFTSQDAIYRISDGVDVAVKLPLSASKTSVWGENV
jgi:sulfur transfer complex TusBCD TusB component (DsrH family)